MTILPRYISRLSLYNFRSHKSLEWQLDNRHVVIVGANGAGKTNILEAISLFTPGRGLRRANANALANKSGDGTWVASIVLEGAGMPVQLGTGVEKNKLGNRSRVVHINGLSEASIAACNQYFSILWLTPDMDRLLRDTPAERRKFLDRLALTVEPMHAQHIIKYEKLMQSRMRLISEYNYDANWVGAIESEMSFLAVAIATTRTKIINLLRATLLETRECYLPLPSTDIWLESEYDRILLSISCEEYESYTKSLLYENRSRDARAGRTLIGPHLTDISVLHGEKSCLAHDASTGEQKALLLRLIIAHAQVLSRTQGYAPIVLLDEVCAHLDPKRREAVLDALDQLGVQVWLTGTDAATYTTWSQKAQFIEIIS